jgi:DNA invertase Pin-like site-specific DNA recombinase
MPARKVESELERWRGKRYICLARQSDDSDGASSTEAQLALIRYQAAELGMVFVDAIALEGVTGSMPGIRTDFDQLMERKRRQNDFEVLVVQVADRMTRGGGNHGAWLEHELNRNGIELFLIDEQIPSGPFASVLQTMKYEAAREQARRIGERSTQGWVQSIAQGRNCVISRTPFGCDRLYLSNERKPQFIIRNLGDGRQQKLDWETRAVIDTYGRVGGRMIGHFRKQKDERVLLVPGDDQEVEAVRLIFEKHYVCGWGGKRIADLLNTRGVPSPTGKPWSQGQVEPIYNNPIYTGWAVGQRKSQGIYVRRGKVSHEHIDLSKVTLATCRSAPNQLRPPEDWIWQEQPHMKGLLSEALAERALERIKKTLIDRWNRSQDPSTPKRSTNKHKESLYVLTGLLFATQDGESMTGILCGRVGQKVRRYRHRRSSRGYRKGSIYNNTLQAEPLEAAVLETVLSVISDTDEVRRCVVDAVRAAAPSATTEAELVELRQKRDGIAQRLQLIVRTFDDASLADTKPELDRLGQQRRELDAQIAQREQTLHHSAEDPIEFAERVLARLERARKNFTAASSGAVRQLLQEFVERVEVNLETREVEISVKIPHSLAIEGDSAMRLAPGSPSPTGDETHHAPALILAVTRCKQVLKSSRICYPCRRIRPAA